MKNLKKEILSLKMEFQNKNKIIHRIISQLNNKWDNKAWKKLTSAFKEKNYKKIKNR